VADGKVFLATWPDEDLARYWARPLVRYAPKSMTDPEILRNQLTMVRQQGFAQTRDEFEEGLVAFAAPVSNGEGKMITAVTIGGPAYRFSPEQEEEFASRVIETAAAISAVIQ
jgi:DNA-binding IclR family transcriptional regulator